MKRLAAVLLAGGLLAACSQPDAPREVDPDGPEPTVTTTEPPQEIAIVASGLDAPWSIAFFGDSALVSQRDAGTIVEIDQSGSVREVGAVEGVAPGGEGGLLGLAVHERSLFVYFTADNDNRIVRYDLVGESGSLSLGERETILDGIPAAGNHNGGRLAIGPDEKLYATTGDAANPALSQDRTSLGGKILRLELNGDVPDDNPFDGSLVYSMGHRNPQGIAWGEDGTMYAAEFGQNTWDELNVIEPGANYGWPQIEGIGDNDAFVNPVQQWGTDDASPSGIAVFDGAVFVANLRGERLRRIEVGGLDSASELFVGEYGRLRDAVAAPDGSLWILTNNSDGRGEPAPDDDRVIQIPAGTS